MNVNQQQQLQVKDLQHKLLRLRQTRQQPHLDQNTRDALQKMELDVTR
jgi:hypothetical protein